VGGAREEWVAAAATLPRRCRDVAATLPRILPGGIIRRRRDVERSGGIEAKDEDQLATNDAVGVPSRTTAAAMPVMPAPLSGDRDGVARPDADAAHLDSTFRHSYSRDQATLVRRLRRIEGQVRGIEKMIERHEYCVDILQQTAALRAAVDSVALLILEDHVQGCVRTAAQQGDPDRYIEEVLDVVRRTLGKPVRTRV
jgi:DNA-binding FrmR family transcriptional regulator